MTIWTPHQPILPDQYLDVRNAAARAYDDQKVPPYKPRLPIIFCQFKYPAQGLTVEGSEYPKYCLVDSFSTSVGTLIHEAGHAAGLHHIDPTASSDNVMNERPGSTLLKAQVRVFEKAYFVS